MRLGKTISGLFLLLTLLGCARFPEFGFKSATVPEGDIFIANFINENGGGPPDMAQNFTEDLKEYYQRNAKKLKIVDNYIEGETFKLEGNIIGYDVSPEGFTNTGTSEGSANNKLTITIEATYLHKDAYDPSNKEEFQKLSFQKKRFSFYALYPASSSLNEVEESLIDEITEQIIQDIYTASFDTW